MLVGLSGLKSSGKDTVANYLVKKHGFIHLSFATPLKDAIASIFNWDREMLDGLTEEHRCIRETDDPWWTIRLNLAKFTPRIALTSIGTDILRKHLSEDIWVFSMERKIENIKRSNPNARIVVSDVRYPNELNMLKANKAITCLISRGTIPEWWDSAVRYNQKTNTGKKLYKFYLTHIDRSKNFVNENIHSSEYSLAGYSFKHVLKNNGSITSVQEEIERVLKLRF